MLDEHPDEHQEANPAGFWALPWGWISVGLWVAMVAKNMWMGAASPHLAAIILLGLIDVAAVVSLILKIIKTVRARRERAKGDAITKHSP